METNFPSLRELASKVQPNLVGANGKPHKPVRGIHVESNIANESGRVVDVDGLEVCLFAVHTDLTVESPNDVNIGTTRHDDAMLPCSTLVTQHMKLVSCAVTSVNDPVNEPCPYR